MKKLINERQDLYKRDSRREKFELLVCRLVQFSETDFDLNNVTDKTLDSIADQWFFKSADIEENSSCLCSQGEIGDEEIKYVTYIKNRFNGNVARIGSSCIEKFGDDSLIKKEAKLLVTLMKNQSVRVNTELAELMAKQKIITQLELALIKELGQKRKLEQGAIDVLTVTKAKIAIEKIPPSVADIAEWIKVFTFNNSENPEFVSPYDNTKVVVSKRLLNEYREIRKKVLVAEAVDYEKQTAIRTLAAFYEKKFELEPEPKLEKPDLDKYQLDKFQVNQCDADEMIKAAKLKVENYLSARNKDITTEEKRACNTLNVLLDAYQRFNPIAYSIDLIDGIQESISRLELEIERLPSAIKKSVLGSEEEIKKYLSRKVKSIEDDIDQKREKIEGELQGFKSGLSSDINHVIKASKRLIKKEELELERLEEKTSELEEDYSFRFQGFEADIQDSIESQNFNISSLELSLDEIRSRIDSLQAELQRLSDNQNYLDETLKEVIQKHNIVAQLNTSNAKYIGEIQEKIEFGIWAGAAIVTLGLVVSIWFNNRLEPLENFQERMNPTLRQIP